MPRRSRRRSSQGRPRPGWPSTGCAHGSARWPGRRPARSWCAAGHAPPPIAPRCVACAPRPPAGGGIPRPHQHETEPHISQVTTDELLVDFPTAEVAFLSVLMSRAGTPRRRENRVGLPADAGAFLVVEAVESVWRRGLELDGSRTVLGARGSDFRFPDRGPRAALCVWPTVKV